MNTQQALEGAHKYASEFEKFIVTYPLVTCIALAWVVSWVLTVTARPFLKAIFPDHLERHFIRVFDVAIAFLVVWDMWPGTFAHWWALGIGGASPFAYFALSEVLCWKWPGLRKYLSLRELADADHDFPKTKPKDPQ